MSSPIWHTSQNGMINSFSRPKIPHRQPGPGTIRWVIQPVFGSNSTSPTYPRRLQSQTLITSFFLNQKYAWNAPETSLMYSMRISYYLFSSDTITCEFPAPPSRYGKTRYRCKADMASPIKDQFRGRESPQAQYPQSSAAA